MSCSVSTQDALTPAQPQLRLEHEQLSSLNGKGKCLCVHWGVGLPVITWPAKRSRIIRVCVVGGNQTATKKCIHTTSKKQRSSAPNAHIQHPLCLTQILVYKAPNFPSHARCALLSRANQRMFLRVLICRHLEIVRQVKISFWIFLDRLEVDLERVLDGEHGVVFDVLAVAIEDLGYDGFVAWGSDLNLTRLSEN